MTGRELVERAMTLLNYTDADGGVSADQNSELYRRSLPAVNQILEDVKRIAGEEYAQVMTLEETLPVTDGVCVGVMTYGICMLIAQSEGDGDMQAIYASLYRQKRNAVPRAGKTVTDVIPSVFV